MLALLTGAAEGTGLATRRAARRQRDKRQI